MYFFTFKCCSHNQIIHLNSLAKKNYIYFFFKCVLYCSLVHTKYLCLFHCNRSMLFVTTGIWPKFWPKMEYTMIYEDIGQVPVMIKSVFCLSHSALGKLCTCSCGHCDMIVNVLTTGDLNIWSQNSYIWMELSFILERWLQWEIFYSRARKEIMYDRTQWTWGLLKSVEVLKKFKRRCFTTYLFTSCIGGMKNCGVGYFFMIQASSITNECPKGLNKIFVIGIFN